jgi:hypothetical protein
MFDPLRVGVVGSGDFVVAKIRKRFVNLPDISAAELSDELVVSVSHVSTPLFGPRPAKATHRKPARAFLLAAVYSPPLRAIKTA